MGEMADEAINIAISLESSDEYQEIIENGGYFGGKGAPDIPINNFIPIGENDINEIKNQIEE